MTRLPYGIKVNDFINCDFSYNLLDSKVSLQYKMEARFQLCYVTSYHL